MILARLLEYRRDPRFVIGFAILILAAASSIYYLIQRANELSPEALGSRMLLFVLWNINLILILGILIVLSRVLIKLILERQRGILGSRFRTKLVVTWVATTLVPIVLLFVVANDLLRLSIDRWFSVPVETLVSNSAEIAEAYENERFSHATRAAEAIARQWRDDEPPPLDELREERDVDVAGLYQSGRTIRLIADPRSPVHELRDPPARFFTQIDDGGFATKTDVVPSGKWLRSGVGAGPNRYVITGVFIPASFARLVDENLIAYDEYRQTLVQRPELKASQTSLFLTATLYILFGALWAAIYVSRRITGPVQALAEGTRTLAHGDYDHRIEATATDELGTLVDSFNAMAGQLSEQRSALTRSNEELQFVNRRLDDERAFLSAVQESLSTGIIAVDDSLSILGLNPAALRLLAIDEPSPGTHVSDFLDGDLAPLADYITGLDSESRLKPRDLSLVRKGELHYFELHAARLGSAETVTGWVIAIEDTTELVQAQKLAAWSEAARRIAHEIKNPLTPIQLSAERIARHAADSPPGLQDVTREGTRIIIEEVAHLKRLVDEFSRFARMPAVHLRRCSIRDILEQAASLYRDTRDDIVVRVEAPEDLEAIVDPEQIKRAAVNLLDNAVAATAEGEIVVRAERRDRAIAISVTDPGIGVPDADKEKLFLPWFSTKKEGTGLGLAIVHRIVHDHDGRISVMDNSPTGTIFEIEIPA